CEPDILAGKDTEKKCTAVLDGSHHDQQQTCDQFRCIGHRRSSYRTPNGKMSGNPATSTAAINITCRRVLSGKAVAGLPPTLRPSRAARMFAGNSEINSIARHAAAAGAVAGIKSPAAPSISKTPVVLTMSSGRGKALGTMATRSPLRFPQ